MPYTKGSGSRFGPADFHPRKISAFAPLLLTLFDPAAFGQPSEPTLAPGEPVDLAAFGTSLSGDGFLGIEWENLREIHEVRLVLPPGSPPPRPEELRLEWWGSVWPSNGRGGWMRLDDPWNGEWVKAPARAASGAGSEVVFTFLPLKKEEWKEASGPEVTFRRTLKLRVISGKAFPPGARLRVRGASRWREASFDLELRFFDDGERSARIEVRNGVFLGLESLPAPRSAAVDGPAWRARGVAGGSAGVRLKVLHTDQPDTASNDRTLVTVRLGTEPQASGFSFVPQDLLSEGALRLPDFGALVTSSDLGLTLAADPGPAGPWPAPVRRRVAAHPEMTRAAAMQGIPRLAPAPAVPLGAPSARQEVVVSALGDWSMWRGSLHTPGRDASRIPFRKDELDAVLDTRAEPRFDGGDREGVHRSLREGHLPLIDVSWSTGPLRYFHSLVATVLIGEIGDDRARRGDETVVLLTRLEVENTSDRSETATVNLCWSHPAPLALRPDGTVAIDPTANGPAVPAGLAAFRGQVAPGPAGRIEGWSLAPATDPERSAILRWQGTLDPREKRALYFKAPYVELLESGELERLKEIRYQEEVPRVLNWWRERLGRGMVIETPSPALNDLYAANLWHVLMTTDRDPETLLYNQNVATFRYKVFANETVMVARSMDLRGEHEEAERFLEPMLHFQGSEALTGRFSTKDGVFHGAGAYTHGKYSMNHGFTLWGIADHYLLTRDRGYLERVAPQVLSACEFIIRERQSTFTPAGAPRSPVHGLAPAGALEDVVEFQYWFATNGYYRLGLARAAKALAEAGHPQAERLAREAELYRRDLERAAREAATRAAAVRLRDGTWIPYLPSRAGQWRHLSEGWIREALYSSLHLATTGVVPASDPLMTWMLDELEDNIFFSEESGYPVTDVDREWFSRGAVTLQPCLLDLPGAYLARDEIPAALRAFWNTYALSIYPDVQCFAEWVPAFGKGGGPLYKTSDESRFVSWLRDLLVWEEGDDRLWFARGAPREWLEEGKTIRVERAATLFGEAGLLIRSRTESGRIEAALRLPTRNPPREVWLRLRNPEGRPPRRVLRPDGTALEPDRLRGEDVRVFPGEDPRSPVRLVAEY